MENLITGFETMLDPYLLLVCLVGAIVGTLGGLLPGIGPVGTMALLLPFVYTMEPLPALIVLTGIVFGANYGNSTSAILLNIPGDPAAAATTIDGHQMAKNGRPGPALSIAALSSTMASLLAIAGVAVLSSVVAPLAIGFGPPEFFGLGLLGLTMVAALGTGSRAKAFLGGGFGLILVLPGLDPVSGLPRFTFGVPELSGGLDLVPVAMGLFAIGELLYNAESPDARSAVSRIGKLLPTRQELRWSFAPALRGSILGFFIGVLPGAGSAPAAFGAYGLETRVARRRAMLGRGIPEGVAAPEAANNAAAGGSFVPMLTLSIPGSAPTALILGALVVLGARPGPLFLSQQQDLFWSLIAALFIATVLLLVLNLPLVGVWASILRVPYPLLTTSLLVVTVAGVYSVQNSLLDVWIALAFGVLGYFLRRASVPMAPIILGFVLGSIIENAFRQSLLLSRGSFDIFVIRPGSLTLLLITAALIILPPVLARARRSLTPARSSPGDSP